MNIIKNRKIFITLSFVMMVISLLSVVIFGFKYSVDFQGGSLLEFKENSQELAGETDLLKTFRLAAESVDLTSFNIQEKGSGSYVIEAKEMTEDVKNDVVKALSESIGGEIVVERFQSIGPTISSEIKSKSLTAIILVILVIIGFITYVFKEVSKPVSSFKYGLVAIMALLHDVLIPAGLFAFLGSFFVGFEINVLFVTAILAILGFSVNDTIVVFDRVRENLRKKSEESKTTEEDLRGENFKEIVGHSLNQTLKRSFLTSLTTLVVLGTLYFMGGETTKEFSLILMVGLIAGTYSSIFFASPLLTLLEDMQDEDKIQAKKDKKQKELEEEYPYSMENLD